ncbi:MAG: sigma-54-dependent Fis family transcriptional regulator [Candidatus Dadabacteria bacterium]|nr:MAG: sigma-54-dependent Fis family transcriptional regulator [Candidatus Dadabacteria bacterium]
MSENILLVDDDSDALLSLTRALKSHGLSASINGASTPEKALKLAASLNPQVAVIDLSLSEKEGVESGFKLLDGLLRNDDTCRVIVLTGHGSTEYGIRALNSGAASFLEKPANISHLAALIQDGFKQASLKRAYKELQKVSAPHNGPLLIGESTVIEQLRSELLQAASHKQPVLLSGETGTGKGLCAAFIHFMSHNSLDGFVRYQPVFGNADIVNSDLFGHVRGAFTGAEQDRTGLIEKAEGGTFFLDEIDQLPLQTQVALLGVFQDRSFRPVGSSEERVANFRLVSACNKDIDECLQDGSIRADFFHRIAHFQIELPPLRKRKEDIPLLAQASIERLRQQEEVNVYEIDQTAIEKLLSYDWPGNVRELLAVVERAAFAAQFKQRSTITADDIHTGSRKNDNTVKLSFHERVEQYKLSLINDALSRNQGNQAQAARELGMDRSTLRRILDRNMTK